MYYETSTLILHYHFEIVENKYYLTYDLTYEYRRESEIYFSNKKEVSVKKVITLGDSYLMHQPDWTWGVQIFG